MTDTNALRECIKSKGLKLNYIAEQLGITPYALQLKIENKSDFKGREIQTLCDILGIGSSLQLKEAIFFNKEVD